MRIVIFILFLLSINIYAETIIKSDINQDTQWLKDAGPFIIENSIKINYGATLSISEGTQIFLKNDVQIIAEGNLNISGTPDDKVEFKGYQGQNWDRIFIQNNSILYNVIFENGGSINKSPIYTDAANSLLYQSIELNENVSNTIGFEPANSGILELNVTEIPYTIHKNAVIRENVELIVNPEVEIIIDANVLLRVRGELTFNGKHGDEIIIYNPNALWGGIYFDNTSKATFYNTIFKNGGNSQLTQNSMIFCDGAELFFELCKFENSTKNAITILQNSNVEFYEGEGNSAGYNSFVNYSKPAYAVVNLGTDAIDLSKSCFGTDDINEIDNMIYDGKDRSGKGIVTYLPLAETCESLLPEKIILTSPADSSIDQPINLTLKWQKDVFASSYDCEVINYDLQEQEVKTSKLLNLSLFNLDYFTQYNWRVRGKNDYGTGEWSDYFTFTTYDTSRPKPPEIIDPEKLANLNCYDDISWKTVKNADEYILQISSEISFNQMIINENFGKQDTLFSFFPGYDENYYLRIRGKNRNGWGDWSEVYHIHTAKLINEIALNYSNDIIKDIHVFNDETLKIAIITEDNNIKIYDYDTKEQVFEYSSNEVIRALIIQDLNNDNIPEYIIALENSIIIKNSIDIVIPNISAKKILVADLNNNGGNDIIAYDENQQLFKIYYDPLNDENSEKTIPINQIISHWNVYDIDKDSDLDIVFIANNILSVFINDDDEFSQINLQQNVSADEFQIELDQSSGNIDIYLFGNSDNITKNQIDNELKIIKTDQINIAAESLHFNNLDDDSDLELIAATEDKIIIELNDNNRIIQSKKGNKVIYKEHILSNFITFEDDSIYQYDLNLCIEDSPSNEPTDLRYTFSDDDIILEWEAPEDDLTGKDAIKYQLEIVNYDSGEYIKKISLQNFESIELITDFYMLRDVPTGKYKWRVAAIDNAGNITYSEENIFRTKGYSADPPSSWFFSKKTGSNTLLILRDSSEPEFKGRKFVSGDAVGVFYYREGELVCGGYGIWEEGKNMPLTAWGDNYQTDQIKDGFEFGEDFKFKFWDSLEEKEHNVIFEISSGPSFFKSDTVIILSKILEPDTHKVVIQPNVWNYISSPVVPYESSITKLFPNVFLKNESGKSTRDGLELWKSSKGYEAYFEGDTAKSYEIIGSNLSKINTAKEYILEANKWYLVPNPHQSKSKLSDNFFNNLPKGFSVNDKAEFNWYSDNQINFNEIDSDESIFIMSLKNDTLNLSEFIITEKSDSNLASSTGSFHLLKLIIENAENSKINFNDINGNTFAESFANNYYDSVYVYLKGDNPETAEKEGFYENEEIFLEIVKNDEKIIREFVNIIDLQTKESYKKLKFSNKGTSIADATISTGFRENIVENVYIYPNPAKERLIIVNNVELPYENFSIIDNLGKCVLQGNLLKGINQLELNKISSGKYKLHLKNSLKSTDINILIVK